MRLKASIRARMTLAFVMTIATLLFVVCGALSLYARRQAEQSVDQELGETLATMRHELGEDDRAERDLAATLAEHEGGFEETNVAVLVVDARGRVQAASRRVVPRWPRNDQTNDGWRVRMARMSTGGTLVVGLPWRATEAVLRRQTLALLLLSLFVTLAAAVGAWVLVGRTLRPIALLAGQAQNSAAFEKEQNRSPCLQAPSPDAEVVHLVHTLNGLLARVEETARTKGRFYAAASHELRTPLQALSGHLEVALSKPRTAEAYHATIEEACAQTRRLTSLVRDLLLLNQLDAATGPPPKEPVDIAEICERVLRQLWPALLNRELKVSMDLPDEEVTILAPPMHAHMLLRNLIENAVKYVEPGGTVRVRVITFSSSEMAGVEVFNSFPLFPRLNAGQLFEPFFRPDASRNAATGGNGLGLAICRAIAVANGWDLRMEQDDEGVRAAVCFASGESRK